MPAVQLRFVHLSDTHISADPTYNYESLPVTPAVGARRLVEAVNALPFRPDFILHTGDVAADPNEADYVLAREIFAPLRAPIYYLPGNHDGTALLQRVMLGRAPTTPYDYEFEVKGVQILCIDSNQPVDADMPYSRLHDSQLEWLLARFTADDPRPLVVATHHNVLPVASPWLDDYMRMQNGEAFHRALLPARHRLLGVLHGHIHQNIQIVRDGIVYLSAASSWYQLDSYSGQTETVHAPTAQPGFNVVTITDTPQMFVRQYAYG